jgi:prepilin-type N-terminal cleavage/methylation domain-containing protein
MRMRDAGYGIQGDEYAHRFGVPSDSRILHPESCKGFTLLELIVVISVVAILAGSLLSRIPYYQEQAEKTVVEQMAGAMQSALIMRYGSLMAHGAGAEKGLNALANANPMDWLQQKPKNYAGEFFDPTPKTVSPGHWMFDLKSHELIYVLDRSDYFTPGKDGQKWIRFHVKLEYESPAGSEAEGKKALASTLFEPTEPYHWFD